MGLPYVIFFFRLGLVSHLLFGIDVGFGQWACSITNFFFFQILVKKKKFWAFFCLKVEKIILLLLFKGVPDFALEGVHIFF